jgi:hypothetical protein
MRQHTSSPVRQFVQCSRSDDRHFPKAGFRAIFTAFNTRQPICVALVEASRHSIGSPVDYVLLFCCLYDPMTGKYTVAIYRVLKMAGAGTLLLVLALIFFLNRSANKPAVGVSTAATAHR